MQQTMQIPDYQTLDINQVKAIIGDQQRVTWANS